jgi:hypothetical protein
MRLKTIALANYLGMMSQVNFVRLFVLNANLLESVTLGINARNNNEEFLAEQCMKLQIENTGFPDMPGLILQLRHMSAVLIWSQMSVIWI